MWQHDNACAVARWHGLLLGSHHRESGTADQQDRTGRSGGRRDARHRSSRSRRRARSSTPSSGSHRATPTVVRHCAPATSTAGATTRAVRPATERTDYALEPGQGRRPSRPRRCEVRTTPDATCALLTNGKVYCWGSELLRAARQRKDQGAEPRAAGGGAAMKRARVTQCGLVAAVARCRLLAARAPAATTGPSTLGREEASSTDGCRGPTLRSAGSSARSTGARSSRRARASVVETCPPELACGAATLPGALRGRGRGPKLERLRVLLPAAAVHAGAFPAMLLCGVHRQYLDPARSRSRSSSKAESSTSRSRCSARIRAARR